MSHCHSYVNELTTVNMRNNTGEAHILKQGNVQRWILSNLIASLQHHVKIVCKIHRHGTLVYRSNSCLTTALTNTLAFVRKTQATNATEYETTSNEPSKKTCFMDVLNDLNTRVHNQAKQFLIKQETCPFEHNTVKIEEFIDEVDPVLWETICLLTRSKTERREKTKHATCSKSQSKF